MPDITFDQLRDMDAARLGTTAAEIADEIRSLHAREMRGSELNDDDAARLTRLIGLHEAATERLTALERAAAAFHGRGGQTVRNTFGAPGYMQRVNPHLDGADVATLSPMGARDKALAALEARTGTEHLSDAARDQIDALVRRDDPNMDGSALARRVLVTESPAYRRAWQQVMTDPRPMLTQEETEALRAFQDLQRQEMRAMAEGVTTSGGFGVPTFIDPTITLTGQESDNPYLRRADVVNVNTSVWKGVNSAGVTWSFDTEGSAVSDDSPTLAQPTATVFMARGFIPYSIEVGQDYPGFAQEMANLLAAGWDDLLINKLTTGNGTSEPKGILTALSANTNVRVRVTTSGTFAAVDLSKVWKALPKRFRNRSTWFSSVGVQNAIRAFGATYGANFTEDLTAPVLENLYGRSYEITDYLADTTTSTASTQEVAIVGDFSNFVVAMRAGMQTELVPTLLDLTTGRPTGQRGWFSYARVGSTTKSDLAFRLLCNTG